MPTRATAAIFCLFVNATPQEPFRLSLGAEASPPSGRFNAAVASYRARILQAVQEQEHVCLLRARYEKMGISEVGWLRREGEVVKDGTKQFNDILASLSETDYGECYNKSHGHRTKYSGADESNSEAQDRQTPPAPKLKEFVYLLVPGLLSAFSPPLYFYETLRRFETLGKFVRLK